MTERIIDPSVQEVYEVGQQYVRLGEGLSEEKLKTIIEDIKSVKREPGRLMKAGIALAKNSIIDLEKKLEIPIRDMGEAKVAILSDTDYRRIYYDFSGVDAETSTGVYTNILDMVLVQEKFGFNYVSASDVFHEFIHRFIDRKIQVITEFPMENGTVDYEYETRRIGLKIKNIRSGEGINDLLNELGNYLQQKKFIDKLLLDPDFKEEASKREEYLHQLGFVDGKSLSYTVKAFSPDGHKVNARIAKDNLHFDLQGNVIYNLCFFAMQLGSDLEKLLANDGGMPFGDLILLAKVNPKTQNELRNRLDAQMGKGFYKKLRTTSYDVKGLLDIFEEVQKKLYP